MCAVLSMFRPGSILTYQTETVLLQHSQYIARDSGTEQIVTKENKGNKLNK